MKNLATFWRKYKSFAHKLGLFQSKVILTVFYFLLSPFGIFFTRFKDELKMKSKPSSTWVDKNNQTLTLDLMKNQ